MSIPLSPSLRTRRTIPPHTINTTAPTCPLSGMNTTAPTCPLSYAQEPLSGTHDHEHDRKGSSHRGPVL